jgi:hypothetical protein
LPGSQAQNRNFSSDLGLERETSPFKVPNDEEVFITREREKLKRAQERRIQSARPIWDKNTASSSAPRIKIRDEDIEPTKVNLDAPSFSYSVA